MKALSLLSVALLLSLNGAPAVFAESTETAADARQGKMPMGAVAPAFTPSELPYPFSSAVQVGDILYLSGDLGADASGKALVPGGIVPETRRMFERIGATLQRHGLGFDSLFKCTVMLSDMSEWPQFNAIYAEYFEPGRYPTRSAMGVSGLALGARVEMECVAWNPR